MQNPFHSVNTQSKYSVPGSSGPDKRESHAVPHEDANILSASHSRHSNPNNQTYTQHFQYMQGSANVHVGSGSAQTKALGHSKKNSPGQKSALGFTGSQAGSGQTHTAANASSANTGSAQLMRANMS
jgi:hypothetical protein